jgi:hypothetical protein
MNKYLVSSLAILAGLSLANIAAGSAQPSSAQSPRPPLIAQAKPQAKPQVITLTQVACQFVETEAKDYNFTSKKTEDCKATNRKTLENRKKGFKPMKLKPGNYVFRVTNQDVPYELGFYLRGAGIKGATLPKLSGGGLTEGQTKEYSVTLKPGTYVFNCPLNPTPDYTLVVQ